MLQLTDKRNGFMNHQIAVSKTSKRIIETKCSLRLAKIDSAEKIHALSEESENGRRVYSRIKLNLIDIEDHQNDNLEFNLKPNEVLWLLYRSRIGVTYKQNYTDTLYRRWPGKDGVMVETSVTIKYTKTMRYPFRVEIKRMEGISDNRSNGAIAEGKNVNMIDMLLSEQAFFSLMNDTARYMRLWELTFACNLIKERHARDEMIPASQMLRLKQISVRKTEDTVFEFLDSLKPADVEYAENIYSGERYYFDDHELVNSEGSKLLTRDHSRLTLKIRDTKNKTANGKQVTAGFALSVPDINYIIAAMEPSILFKKDFEFNGFRKWGSKDGLITHTMIHIQYQRYFDQSKNLEYDYPFYINIINRTGKGDISGNKIIKKESECQLSVRLTPFEFFSMLMDCKRYMDIFEVTYGIQMIEDKSILEKKKSEEYLREKEWRFYNVV